MVEVLAYGPADAGKALGVSESTVWRLIRSGELATFKLGARTLIAADDLRALVARRRAAGRPVGLRRGEDQEELPPRGL